MKIYIAGSITNNPNYIEEFATAEELLTKQGYEVVNPAKKYLRFIQRICRYRIKAINGM